MASENDNLQFKVNLMHIMKPAERGPKHFCIYTLMVLIFAGINFRGRNLPLKRSVEKLEKIEKKV